MTLARARSWRPCRWRRTLPSGSRSSTACRARVVAARLGEQLGVDDATARSTFYISLLFYVGCTAGSELASEVFGADDALTVHGTPVRFGSRPEMVRGMLRAVAPPGGSIAKRAGQLTHLPRLARNIGGHATRVVRGGPHAERAARPAAIGR